MISDAVSRSKLLYGLETIHLTEDMKRKLNPIQLRGLRQITKSTHTYYNRAHTNQYTYDAASKLAHPDGNKTNKKIQRLP